MLESALNDEGLDGSEGGALLPFDESGASPLFTHIEMSSCGTTYMLISFTFTTGVYGGGTWSFVVGYGGGGGRRTGKGGAAVSICVSYLVNRLRGHQYWQALYCRLCMYAYDHDSELKTKSVLQLLRAVLVIA